MVLPSTDWVIALAPIILTLMGAWVSLNALKGKAKWIWMSAFIVVGFGLARTSLVQLNDSRKTDKITREMLVKQLQDVGTQLANLKRVNPLRKEAFNLASELREFVAERRAESLRGVDRSGRTALTAEQQARVMSIYKDGVKQYHERYDKRIAGLLREISSVTGKNTSSVQASALDVREMALETVTEVSDRISDLAGSLP